ncbi:MAG: redoxin domain-containing protein [Planctomycetaceae bacterium]
MSPGDPCWILLHEPAVIEELKLGETQRQKLRSLTDELDRRYFPLRNKPTAVAAPEFGKIVAEAREGAQKILKPAQGARLAQLAFQQLGTGALVRDDVVSALKLSETQRGSIRKIVDETQQAVLALEKEVAAGKPREPLEKKFVEFKTDEQKQALALLSTEQTAAWRELVGPIFDASQLGRAAYKAPEFIDATEWINSPPLSLEKLRGKVVVVHFYACGCINCIHNYPWYRQWHEAYRNKGVALIGVHTPETPAERDPATVRQKAADEKLTFPILIDGQQHAWNAWGNSMWPTVYLIDKRGYLRSFWAGELKWQENDGEKILREQIEQLLAEPAP